MSMIAAPLAIGASLFQGIASYQQGQSQAALATAEGQAKQQEMAQDIKLTQISAEQSQAQRLEQLQRTVGTINATVATRGLDPSSPSAMAMVGGANTYAQRNIMNARFNALMQESSDQMTGDTAGVVARAKASAYRAAGFTSALGDFFQAGTKANSAYG